MNRWMSVVVLLCAATGCSSGSADRAADPSSPEPASEALTVGTVAGEWRCVTPNAEFVRLTVTSKSSEAGVLAARLTYSGVYWEGSGRIESGSFVANMTIPGVGGTGVLVARTGEGRTLRVEMRPTSSTTSSATTTELTFVRES